MIRKKAIKLSISFEDGSEVTYEGVMRFKDRKEYTQLIWSPKDAKVRGTKENKDNNEDPR